jgi:hopanoid C-2 methylase
MKPAQLSADPIRSVSIEPPMPQILPGIGERAEASSSVHALPPTWTSRAVTPRRILCVFPKYVPSFGTFHYSYPLIPGVRAFMPPQGILTVAAYLPKNWEVRFVDENVAPAKTSDYAWSDVVMISGMHVQSREINRINGLAHAAGKLTVLGGPSVSACPEKYPDIDVLHIGELGDGTDDVITYISENVSRPAEQVRFRTVQRLALDQFPMPMKHLHSTRPYFLASLQFSSGCPYTCEFCDIPELYGRNPRLKTPARVLEELDAMFKHDRPGAVYFVDDNFIGNRRAASELLPHLIQWQKSNGYPTEFACEATLNLAGAPKLLELMREARFHTIFCGIETPEPAALRQISKAQNLAMPILEAVKILNSYGMEVVSGIIIGLDSDTPETAQRILDFVRLSQIPVLTINLLEALPRTPLWRRLEKEGRINSDQRRDSNVDFLLPYDDVYGMWRRCIEEVYDPHYLYERFSYNIEHTYRNRITVPATRQRLSAANLRMALGILGRLMVNVGIRSRYRREFWRMTRKTLKKMDIETMFHVGTVAHHLIQFAQDCASKKQNAAFYSEKIALRA